MGTTKIQKYVGHKLKFWFLEAQHNHLILHQFMHCLSFSVLIPFLLLLQEVLHLYVCDFVNYIR